MEREFAKKGRRRRDEARENFMVKLGRGGGRE